MNAWQSLTSTSFVLAAALLGAGCAASGVRDGDDPAPQAGQPAGDERTGEALLPGRGGFGGGGGGGGGECGGLEDGAYCGGDGVSGDPSTLYQCWHGQKFFLRSCWNGCEWMPPGTADRCR